MKKNEISQLSSKRLKHLSFSSKIKILSRFWAATLQRLRTQLWNPIDYLQIYSKNGKAIEISTGKSLSEALILASTNPQYDDRLFIELRVQYKKTTSTVHVVYANCFLFWHSEQFMYTTCSWHVLRLAFSCTELVIQWTICRHIVG